MATAAAGACGGGATGSAPGPRTDAARGVDSASPGATMGGPRPANAEAACLDGAQVLLWMCLGQRSAGAVPAACEAEPEERLLCRQDHVDPASLLLYASPGLPCRGGRDCPGNSREPGGVCAPAGRRSLSAAPAPPARTIPRGCARPGGTPREA